MNLSILKYLILSIFFFSACYVPKNSVRLSNQVEVPLVAIIDLDSNTPVLYSAEFEVMKYKFSGLIAFRYMPENKETRIVFLSEVGIKIMEFAYRDGKIYNTFCIEAVQRKSIVKFLGSFLEMLLSNPECHSVYLNKTDAKSDYFCKLKKGSATYKFTGTNRTNVLLYKGRKKKSEGKYVMSSSLPDEILVGMKHKTQIQLKRVNNAFK
jgi:hypothetical protein